MSRAAPAILAALSAASAVTAMAAASRIYAARARVADDRNGERDAAVELTLASGERLLVARPAEGHPVTVYARGGVYIVTHEGTVTNLADAVDEEGRPRGG